MNKPKFQIVFFCLIVGILTTNAQRRTMSLNGVWEIAKTDTDVSVPHVFPSKVAVPGLVDLAVPAIDQLPKYTNLKKGFIVNAANTDDTLNTVSIDPNSRNEGLYYNNSVYWYRRKFSLANDNNEVVLLKINKSMYHTRIYLNGIFAGENLYSFTPTLIDIKPYIHKSGVENEIIISVGCRNNLPKTVVRGDDFEKFFFIPGIYDDVNIILSEYPFITNVQTAPDINEKRLRVRTEIQCKGTEPVNISYTIRELKSGKKVAKGNFNTEKPVGKNAVADFHINIPKYKLWSPESPFLYELEMNTSNDKLITRFGMRSFKTNTEKGVVELNGQPYYMRGTNICLFRFFEDKERGDLPWNNNWVLTLNKRFKEMHWNSYRFTIGFPPERWYEIADSIGFLVQDEYPIWKGHKPIHDEVTGNSLAKEYTTWMRERWNHPCVVIWDAQNESVYDTTAIAINKVRSLDLSNRPWDNGWAVPTSKTDVIESHPYLLYPHYAALKKHEKAPVKESLLKDLFSGYKTPGGPHFMKQPKDEPFKNPIILNEYAWLWLNRDGSPTSVTDVIYSNLFPEADTPEKRLEVFAKLLAMETEFWRSHRKLAGLMSFCGLGYSHSTNLVGVTSDNFSDIRNLIFEPHYYKFVRSAFSPVGIMLDFWENKIEHGKTVSIPVNLINDTYQPWQGKINLSVLLNNKILVKKSVPAKIESLGISKFATVLQMPVEKGNYKLVAELIYKGERVNSIREFTIE